MICNLRIIPGCDNNLIPNIAIMLSSVVSFMIVYGIATDQLNYLDYIDFMWLIVIRCIVIASKYGFYRPKHQKIIENSFITAKIADMDLVL